jgi:DNA primase
MRGLITAMENGLDVFLITLPRRADGSSYKDPDECIRENPESWKQAIAQAEPLLEHFFRRATEERDLTKLEDKRAVVRDLIPIIARVPDTIASAHYLQRLAALVSVPEADLRGLIPQKTGGALKLRPTAAPSKTVDSWRRLSDRVLAMLIAAPSQSAYVIGALAPELIAPELATLYKAMVVFYTKESSTQQPAWQSDAFRRYLANEPDHEALLQTLDVLFLLSESEFAEVPEVDLQREISETVRRLRKRYLQEQLRNLEQEIRAAELVTPRDENRLRELLVKFQNDSAVLTTLES